MTVRVIDRFAGPWHALSNFSRHRATIGGFTYPTVEYGFHAAKIADPALRAELYGRAGGIGPDGRPISGDELTNEQIKRWGKTVPLRDGWEDGVDRLAMSTLLVSKFVPPGEPRDVLLATGSAVLIEGNRWCDNRWGDCRCGRPACRPRGLNYLGTLLMGIRDTIRAMDLA